MLGNDSFELPVLALRIVYALNALWFAVVFVQFSLAQRNTLKILVPSEAREDRLAPTIPAAVAFLGGMNGAIGLFCIFLAARPDLFAAPAERVALLAFLAMVNFSQFFFNLPILVRGGRRGVAYWPVLSGPMLLVFVVDGALTIIDSVAAALVA